MVIYTDKCTSSDLNRLFLVVLTHAREFRNKKTLITCYEKINGRWNKVGDYVPDFLIVKRKRGQIHQAMIVETKGSIYANDPKFQKKRKFTEETFTVMNNELFGYKRFDYLYIQDTMSEAEWQLKIKQRVDQFFMKGGKGSSWIL